MKLVKKILFIFFILTSLVSIHAYKVPPSTSWIFAFTSHFALFFVIINFILFLFLLKSGKWITATIFLITSLSGVSHINATIQLRNKDYKEVLLTPKRFKVLSYNLSSFRIPTLFSHEYNNIKYNALTLTIKKFIKTNDAEIMCFQEFFDDKNSNIHNNIEDLAIRRGYHYYFAGNPANNGTHRGLVIISKFPIINYGDVFISDNGYNGGCFADVVTPLNDTIRIINTHLHSMRIKAAYNQMSSTSIHHLYYKYRYIIGSFRRGSIVRETQIEKLIRFIKLSKYPTVLCGDLNDTPYSYTYKKIKENINNTFENTGRGFDFTLNSKSLFFLRIDNQFYSSEITPLLTTPISSFKASDHYPIESIYAIN